MILGVVAVVLFAHWPALSSRALSFDDSQYLGENHLVRNPSWASASRFLSEILAPSTVEGYYQPLTMISLMLDCGMGGSPENLAPFHRTSLALHAANTALIVVLLYLLFGGVWPAALAGLLFGVHPLTVEPISWVAERKTLLATFFVLWSLLSYVRFVQTRLWRWYTPALGAFVLALLSKPTVTPLPFLLFLLDFWPLRRLHSRVLAEKIPFFVIGGLSAAITYISQGITAGVYSPSALSPLQIPLTLCHNVIFYLWKMIWPVNLSSYYPFPEPMSLAQPMVLLGVLGTPVLIALLLVSLRWTRALLTGWLFFFLAILPTMGIVGFTVVIASDRYAYFPAVGLLLILAAGLARAWSGPWHSGGRTLWRSGALAIVVLLCGLESAGTRRCVGSWRDSERRARYMLALTPNEPYLHDNLATVLSTQGDSDGAIAHYTEAVRLEPGNYQTQSNLAIALAAQGRLPEAITHYTAALALRPTFAQGHNNLALALAQQGQLGEAIAHWTEALRLRPLFAEAHSNLGRGLAAQGRLDEAVGHLMEAVRLWPTNPGFHANLGNALLAEGQINEAIAEYTTALRLDPASAETHNNLGFALAREGKIDAAIEHYDTALRIQPVYPQAHVNLADGLVRQGRLDQALQHYQTAIQLNPTSAAAHKGLGAVWERLGKTDAAMQAYQEALRLNPRDSVLRDRLQHTLRR